MNIPILGKNTSGFSTKMPGHHFLHWELQDGTKGNSSPPPTRSYWRTGRMPKSKHPPLGQPCPALQHYVLSSVLEQLRSIRWERHWDWGTTSRACINRTLRTSRLTTHISSSLCQPPLPPTFGLTTHSMWSNVHPLWPLLLTWQCWNLFLPFHLYVVLNHSLCELYFWIYEGQF